MALIENSEFKRRLNSFDSSEGACKGRRRRDDVIAVAAIVGTVFAVPALAVDIVNRDKAEREVVVNRADGSSETLILKPGAKMANVCDDCIVLVGDSSVEVKGNVTVKIEGGKVSIGSQR